MNFILHIYLFPTWSLMSYLESTIVPMRDVSADVTVVPRSWVPGSCMRLTSFTSGSVQFVSHKCQSCWSLTFCWTYYCVRSVQQMLPVSCSIWKKFCFTLARYNVRMRGWINPACTLFSKPRSIVTSLYRHWRIRTIMQDIQDFEFSF